MMPKHAVICLVIAAASLPARAQSPAPDNGAIITDEAKKRGKALFTEGQRLFELRRFAEALEKYQQAYEAAPLPGLLFNIGQAYVNLEQLDAALFSFRRYLSLAPAAANRDAVAAYIKKIEAQLRKNEEAAERRRQLPPPPPAVKEPPKPTVVATKPADSSPVYKRWWFWGGIVALAGAGVAGTVLLTADDGPPNTDLGNISFP